MLLNALYSFFGEECAGGDEEFVLRNSSHPKSIEVQYL